MAKRGGTPGGGAQSAAAPQFGGAARSETGITTRQGHIHTAIALLESRSGEGDAMRDLCTPAPGVALYDEGARRRGRFSTGGLGAPASRSWSLRKIIELMS